MFVWFYWSSIYFVSGQRHFEREIYRRRAVRLASLRVDAMSDGDAVSSCRVAGGAGFRFGEE